MGPPNKPRAGNAKSLPESFLGRKKSRPPAITANDRSNEPVSHLGVSSRDKPECPTNSAPPATTPNSEHSAGILPIDTTHSVTITNVEQRVLPSEPVHEQIGLSSSASSLTSLKAALASTTRIPYIPPMAALLIKVLSTIDDVKQTTNKWNATEVKVRKSAALVGNVGRKCEDDSLEEDDLPPSMHNYFQSLETELHSFERALETSRIKGEREVKERDGKISKVLQDFQATLTFDPLFSRCAEGIEVEVTYVDARYDDDQTPLHVASQLGQHHVIDSLINRGANPNAVNAFKETPLSLASRNGNVEVALALLSRGAHVDHVDSENRTSLHEASERGQHAIARLLLQYKADPNAKNAYEWTALHLASRTGNLMAVESLLEHGAEVNVVNRSLWTPLHLASQEGHVNIVESLLITGAGVDERNADGETALHLSAYYGCVGVVEVLIQHYADRHVRNKKQKTAMDLAGDRGYRNVVQLLEETGTAGG